MACSGVTAASSCLLQPRNGPPDAVRIRRDTSAALPPRSAWAMAECSESTATSCPGEAASTTRCPPITSDSLLARANVLPADRAARVGSRPTAPVMALTTTSHSETASSAAASGPVSTSGLGSWSRASSSSSPGIASGFATATLRGWNCAICSASLGRSLPEAANATTSKSVRRPVTTSRVWVPMDPVEPSSTILRTQTVCHATPTESRRTMPSGDP